MQDAKNLILNQYEPIQTMQTQDTLNIIWTSQEIIDHAKDGMGIDLSIEDARKVLRLLERKHDSEVGINWHSITCAIEDITGN